MLHLRKIALFLAVVFCISLAGCSADAPQSKAAGSIDQTAVYRQNSASQQTQNLAKLCKCGDMQNITTRLFCWAPPIGMLNF